MKAQAVILALALSTLAAMAQQPYPPACGMGFHQVTANEPTFVDTDTGCIYKCRGGEWSLSGCPGDGGPGGPATFTSITSGTNIQASMVVGVGATLYPNGGTIVATTAGALVTPPQQCAAGTAPRGITAAGEPQNCTAYLQSEGDGSTTNEAPLSGPYVVMSAGNGLTGARVLTPGTAMDVVDGGAGSLATFNWDSTEVNTTSYGDDTQASFTQTYKVLTGVDPAITYGDDLVTFSTPVKAKSFQAERLPTTGASLELTEGYSNGDAKVGFQAPAAIGTGGVCSLLDSTNGIRMIPNTCVVPTTSGSVLPTNPAPVAGDLFLLTGASTTNGVCATGGSVKALCRYSGSAWEPFGDGGSGGAFAAADVDDATWSDGSTETEIQYTYNLLNATLDPVVKYQDGNVDFNTAVTATSFASDRSPTTGATLELPEGSNNGDTSVGLRAPASIATAGGFCVLNDVANGVGLIPAACVAGGGGTGYATIQEEESGLAQESVLNFAGTAITCAAGTGKTTCTVSAAAPSHAHAAGDVTSGTLVHERGGLEADVSAYAGLVRISGGATSAVTNLAGLNTALGTSIADGAHTVETNSLSTLTTGIADNQIPMGTGTNAVTYKTMPATGTAGCSGTSDKMLYNTTTDAWSCGVDAFDGVLKGTMTNGRVCTYASSGTLLSCDAATTGTAGSAVVLATSPTLVTPSLGAAKIQTTTATSGTYYPLLHSAVADTTMLVDPGLSFVADTNILSTTSGVVIGAGTVPTIEGHAQWDGTNDRLVIGDNTTTKTFYSGPHTTDTGITALTGEVTASGNGSQAATIADNVTVTGWTMGASVADLAGANDSDTSLATTSFVQQEINGAGQRSLTCASGNCDADAELYTRVESIAIDTPAAGDSGTVQLMFPTAVTITRIACSTNVTSSTATIQFDERAAATPNTAGTDVMTSTLVCDTDEQATTTFTNASIAARVPMNLDIDAVATAPTKLRIFVEYTVDD